jgi:hypothetical protein
MLFRDRVSVARVHDEAGRAEAMGVLRATYRDEKGWVEDESRQIPAADLHDGRISWFVVRQKERPVGVLRVLYDPPLGLYAEYGMKLIVGDLDVEKFVRENRIAEIGRFAVLPECRGRIVVVAALMRDAVYETCRRGYTHYITDVFEDDPHSPYQFHTNVMGFIPVATHDFGELNSTSRRITMILDLRDAYRRLKEQGGWIYRFFTANWDEAMHRDAANGMVSGVTGDGARNAAL